MVLDSPPRYPLPILISLFCFPIPRLLIVLIPQSPPFMPLYHRFASYRPVRLATVTGRAIVVYNRALLSSDRSASSHHASRRTFVRLLLSCCPRAASVEHPATSCRIDAASFPCHGIVYKHRPPSWSRRRALARKSRPFCTPCCIAVENGPSANSHTPNGFAQSSTCFFFFASSDLPVPVCLCFRYRRGSPMATDKRAVAICIREPLEHKYCPSGCSNQQPSFEARVFADRRI